MNLELVRGWLKIGVFVDGIRVGIFLIDTRQWLPDDDFDALTDDERIKVLQALPK